MARRGRRWKRCCRMPALSGSRARPLMKVEKNTARKFGGLIEPAYTIDQAVKDKAVVPLLYEGRLVLQLVDRKAIDKWFAVVTKPLTEGQRADLKRKFSTTEQLNKAERKIYEAAFDISEHYSQNWQATGFKAQLAAPSKRAALKYKQFLDEFGKVSSEVVISAPDTREENEDVDEVDSEEVRAFWKKMMAKYGSEKKYNAQIINAFKHAPEPEILIVVSKLLTGFDAPRNTVLYVCRSLVEHNLLQAIARVNRLYEGKDFGYILDYFGVLQELGKAMDVYGHLPGFEAKDLDGTVQDVASEVASLPQKHSELWDVFRGVKNRLDEEEYEKLLADDGVAGTVLRKAVRLPSGAEYGAVHNGVFAGHTGEEAGALQERCGVLPEIAGVGEEALRRGSGLQGIREAGAKAARYARSGGGGRANHAAGEHLRAGGIPGGSRETEDSGVEGGHHCAPDAEDHHGEDGR